MMELEDEHENSVFKWHNGKKLCCTLRTTTQSIQHQGLIKKLHVKKLKVTRNFQSLFISLRFHYIKFFTNKQCDGKIKKSYFSTGTFSLPIYNFFLITLFTTFLLILYMYTRSFLLSQQLKVNLDLVIIAIFFYYVWINPLMVSHNFDQ